MYQSIEKWDISLHQTLLIMGESRIIVVSNQKGGAGKSTLCMLLANFLNKAIHLPVGAIIDTDFQKSIVKKREEDLKRYKGSTMVPPYQVVSYSLENNTQIPSFINQLRETEYTYIIDTPGSMNENGVFSFLAMADYIICPFDFSELSLTSTTHFLMRWRDLKEEIKIKTDFDITTDMVLVPCLKPRSVGTDQEKELWGKVKAKFEELYHVAPEIPNSSDIRRADTMDITPGQMKAAGDTLNYIAELIYNPNNDNNEDNDEDEQ